MLSSVNCHVALPEERYFQVHHYWRYKSVTCKSTWNNQISRQCDRLVTMSKVCPTASAVCTVDPGIKDEVCTPASSAQPEEKLLGLVRVPQQGTHNATCSERALAIDDIRSPAHIPSYEDFLRAIFEANWHAVAQVAWHVGQTSYVPGIYRS
ncbi:hypothetical protein DM02DRAFT_89147, partial [Periconia macrospinosa]